MTKAEFIKALEPFPDDARVFVEDWQEQYTGPALCDSIKYEQRCSNDYGGFLRKGEETDEFVIVLG